MHGEGTTGKRANETRLKKANECIRDQKYFVCGQLFDAFWREGELALLFGAPGTGKSILATQIAEGIARGTGVKGFGGTVTRRRVLYVDLKLSDGQHKMRYQRPFDNRPEKRSYRFSENFYREAPPDVSKLAEWVRERVAKNSIRAVVIDDLSAVKRSGDGLRETLPLIRDLRALARELEISILVIAGSREARRGLVSDADLQRSQVLCDIADSTFAIGMHPASPDAKYLIQTRSVYQRVWSFENAPTCNFERDYNGFIHFAFDKRFVPELDEETRRLICDVKHRKDDGASLRGIGEALGFSRTKAARLLKEWKIEFEEDAVRNPAVTPETETDEITPDDESDEWEECGFEKPVWVEDELVRKPGVNPGALDSAPGVTAGFPPEDEPVRNPGDISRSLVLETDEFDGAPGVTASVLPEVIVGSDVVPVWEATRSIFLALGYEVMLDDYGKELFVESEDESGRPVIAYGFHTDNGKIHSSGRLTRWRNDRNGRSGDTVHGPVCWLNFDPNRPGIVHIARVYLKHAEART